MSVMSKHCSVIIYQGISAPGHGNEVVYGLNAVNKRYIYQFISTVQLHGSNTFDSQMRMHTGNQKYDVSSVKEFQHHLIQEHRKNVVIDQGNTINGSRKENVQTDSIMFRIILMLHTKI